MNIKTTRRYKYDVKKLPTEFDEFKWVKMFFDDCRCSNICLIKFTMENFQIFQVIDNNPDKTLNEKEII